MNQRNDRNGDWELLTPALRSLAIWVVVGTILFLTGEYLGRSAFEMRSQQETRAMEARNTYYRAREARAVIADFSERYEYWRERGVIGDERRLQWVETLQDAADSLRLPELNYSISPRTVAPDLPMKSTHRVHRSEMKLSLKLLHERDLVDLAALLERNARGLFRMRECELKRGDGADEYIAANCRVEWLTVGEEHGPEKNR